MLTKALARYLPTRGLGLLFGTPGTNVFLEEFTGTTPADAVLIAFKTAPPSDYSDELVQGVSMIVRWGTASADGYAKAMSIRDQLHGLRHLTLDPGGDAETRLVWMRADDAGPTSLGKDANGRYRWSLRFLAHTTHDTTHSIL